jgi:hypothetical protein
MHQQPRIEAARYRQVRTDEETDPSAYSVELMSPDPTQAKHRVLRIQGGRLVVAERRQELEGELDAAASDGFVLVNSFAVDDNVYLVMRKPE